MILYPIVHGIWKLKRTGKIKMNGKNIIIGNKVYTKAPEYIYSGAFVLSMLCIKILGTLYIFILQFLFFD
jgi:hypothetical protein